MQYEQTKVELEEANQEQKLHQQQNQKYEQQVEGQLAFVSEAESAKQKVQITKDALLKKMEKIDTTRQQHEKTREDFANVLSQCLEVCCPPPPTQQTPPSITHYSCLHYVLHFSLRCVCLVYSAVLQFSSWLV